MPSLYDDVITASQQCGFNSQHREQSTQIASAVGMVAAGFGVTIVPDWIRDLHSRA
ncbi:hypothetical protein [Paraburkholderia sp. BR14374]|uniref:hypothetical protein n=1 Tax=unclassified Paraburkholderia TaxID=2615204 RepID=UPI0034CE2AF0